MLHTCVCLDALEFCQQAAVSLKSDKKRQEVSRSDTKRQEDFISTIMQFYVCCIAKSIIFYMYKCLY